ncbi:MAG: hypothetical protein JWQ12_664 [Glaciihabitans sp.]|nr:hypothetical protein [Glaciihabitans sp.]
MLTEALARVADLQEATRRIDAALDEARLTWLQSTPTDELDDIYERGIACLESLKGAIQGELVVVRMGALV